MAGVKPARVYRSGLRAEQARLTRARVLDAAEKLFAGRGYAATTMEAIGTAAGVAVDTVYAGFGTKRKLLAALLDVRVGGDDEAISVLDRPAPQAMRAETDQRRQVAMLADGIATAMDRVRPIDDIMRSAASVDPEIEALRSRVQEQRHTNMRRLAGWIAANGPLRGGLSLDDAAAIVWTATSPEVHRLLRGERGWPARRYREWLADTLIRTLLP
jgi:AcrR family transcriptional regulator